MLIPNTLIEQATAGPDEVRTQFCQPWYDAPNKRLVATDGRIAAVLPVHATDKDPACYLSVDAIEAARKISTGKGIDLVLREDGSQMIRNGDLFPAVYEDAKFPNVDKVIPKANTDHVVGLDAKLLMKLAQALNDTTDEDRMGYLVLYFNDDPTKGIRVESHLHRERYGVITPLYIISTQPGAEG